MTADDSTTDRERTGRGRARRGRSRGRMWQGEPPTEPMPLVDSLRRTPYRNPAQMDAPEEDGQARDSLDLAVRAGELLLRCGAGTRDVESSVVAVAAAAGLDRLEVDITNQSLLVQCVSASGEPLTLLRVVRSSSRDFARLVAVHQFVEDLVAGRIDRAQAAKRLRVIGSSLRWWPRWVISLAYGVLAASVSLVLGAGPFAVAMSVVSAVVVDQLGRLLAQRGLPSFYLSAVGGAVATLLAWGGYLLAHFSALSMTSSEFAYVVAGGIVVLLPGRAMTSAVEDAITGYPVTGAGRMFGVLLTAAGIIVGVAAGLSFTFRLSHGLGLAVTSPTRMDFGGAGVPLLVRVLGAGIGSAASAVAQRTRRRLVLPSAALGALAMLGTDLLHRNLGIGSISALAVSCAVAGFVGRLGALRLGAPALVLVVPAIAPLLPGLAIFRGMYALVSGAVVGHGVSGGIGGAGVTTLLGASATALALATGAVLGDVMASPFDRPIVQRRRARTR